MKTRLACLPFFLSLCACSASAVQPSKQGELGSLPNINLGVAHVVHVRDGLMEPASLDVVLGEAVRFVFDDPGHNVTTVSSDTDGFDPTWRTDGRDCSLASDCYANARSDASPQGTYWDFVAPYAADWPLLCGRHIDGWMSSRELIWVHVR